MRRAWIGIALLAASWLFGLSYYQQADRLWWVVTAAAGAALLIGSVRRTPPAPAALISAALVLPAIWLLPWPYRLGPVLMAAGLAIVALASARPRAGRLGAGLAVAGVVLVAQSVAIEAYAALTARSHALPAVLGQMLAATAELLGVEAAYDGTHLVMFSMRRIHPLAATWGLLLDPVTLCFLVGGAVLIALAAWESLARGREALAPARSAGVLVLAVLLWLPLRAALLIGLYLHRVLRTEYEAPLDLMGQFWSPWVHLALLAGPVLLAWRFARGRVRPPAPAPAQADSPSPAQPVWRAFRASITSLLPIGPRTQLPRRADEPLRFTAGGYVAAVLAFVAAGLITTAVLWNPVGARKPGRVLVDEFHSNTPWPPGSPWPPNVPWSVNSPWPPKKFDTVGTIRRFDTEWYGHESGYNLYCLYDYASRFYEMKRTRGKITADDLAEVDVLVLKVPSLRYGKAEIEAIHEFVDRGGGLLLIGEHTSVFGSGVCLNDIARRYGFEFRYDCLFGIDSVFKQHYTAPIAPHPIARRVGEMDFAISCSVRPLGGPGRAVIRDTGLKSRLANYHASNFYPPAENDPAMRYGSFVQVWATRGGAGRVVAFTDSTIFANFSAFEPGKAELFLGMLEWLNHSGGCTGTLWILAVAGVLVAAAAVVLAVLGASRPMLLVAAAVLGWSVAVVGVRAASAKAMPGPEQLRPMVRVAIDRTVSDAPLPRNGFIAGKEGHFGQFERSILRLGYFFFRAAGEKLAEADLIIVLDPSRTPEPAFRDRLVDHVANGGKLLVLDGPENAKSTANNLLWPFGMSVDHAPLPPGPLTGPHGWPAISVPSARRVNGGTPLAVLNGQPVAAATRHGKGTATVIGFSARFTDVNMGVIGDVIPDAKLRPVFDFEYVLLHAIVHDRLPGVSPPPSTKATTRNAKPG